jgi:hypothetical protein
VSGGVLHHGTHEEDGPVTREVLLSPRLHWLHGFHRGRPSTRGTEVAADGEGEVGGLHTSLDVGELIGNSDPIEQRRPV